MSLKPLVFVPGLPATVLLEQAGHLELFPSLLTLLNPNVRPHLVQKLSGPDDPDADDGVIPLDPIDTVIKGLKSSLFDFSGSLKLADSLYALLQDLGYSQFARPFGDRFRPVGWDWRRPIDQAKTLAAVKTAISDLHNATGERVVILCHSTGGLVTRRLLESDPTTADLVELVIAVAVPWVGALPTLVYLAGQQGFFSLTSAETQHIIGRSWAAFDVLPPDPLRTDMTDTAGNLDLFTKGQSQAGPTIETAWIPAGPMGHPLAVRAARSNATLGQRTRSFSLGGRKLDVVSFAGWGADTLTGCRMDPQGNLAFISSDEGDGTVPGRSAAWLSGDGVKNFLVPVGHYPDSQITRHHSALWMNPPVRDLLGVLLAGRQRPPYAYAAVDGDDAVNNVSEVQVRMVAQDAEGKPLQGAYALAFGLANPPSNTKYGFNGEGRHSIFPLRQNIVQNAGGGFFRFEVEIHWLEGGVDKSSPRQALLVHKST
jgi:hypothetical protein